MIYRFDISNLQTITLSFPEQKLLLGQVDGGKTSIFCK